MEKTKDFTVMCNHHLRNVKLFLKVKELYISYAVSAGELELYAGCISDANPGGRANNGRKRLEKESDAWSGRFPIYEIS